MDLAGAAVKPGMTTDEIDRVVHEAAVARGAYPSPLNYHGFPKRCVRLLYCTVVHCTALDCTGLDWTEPYRTGVCQTYG